MNRDDVLRLAVQCQLVTTGNREGAYVEAIERFATLLIVEERWACIDLCNQVAPSPDGALCAEAIKARGER
jgi:hypothetical protein